MNEEILFESDGIVVLINEEGKLIEADDANVREFVDTPENRANCIADAKATVKLWEREWMQRLESINERAVLIPMAELDAEIASEFDCDKESAIERGHSYDGRTWFNESAAYFTYDEDYNLVSVDESDFDDWKHEMSEVYGI